MPLPPKPHVPVGVSDLVRRQLKVYPELANRSISPHTIRHTTAMHLLQAGVDISVIAEALQRLSQLVTEFPQIKELDINPFIVGREGTTPIAVDSMMTLEKR